MSTAAAPSGLLGTPRGKVILVLLCAVAFVDFVAVSIGRAADLLGRRRMLVAGTSLLVLASLAAGLADNQGTLIGRQSTQLFNPLIEWVGNQFHEMGRSDYADLAVAYLSTVEGASLLANNLRDPEVLARQIRLLEKWIDALE